MNNKHFYARPLTGTGKTAMRLNGDFNEMRERVRQRVERSIRTICQMQVVTVINLDIRLYSVRKSGHYA